MKLSKLISQLATKRTRRANKDADPVLCECGKPCPVVNGGQHYYCSNDCRRRYIGSLSHDVAVSIVAFHTVTRLYAKTGKELYHDRN